MSDIKTTATNFHAGVVFSDTDCDYDTGFDAYLTLERWDIGTPDEGAGYTISIEGIPLKLAGDLDDLEAAIKKLKEEIFRGEQ